MTVGMCVGLVLVAFGGASEKLPIGSLLPKPDVQMRGTDGEMHTLGDAVRANGLLVLFSNNTCPWVKAWENRYLDLSKAALQRDVGVIAVNVNAGSRSAGDVMGDMTTRATNQTYPFPYVLDEGGALATAFGASTTPEVFLFNGDRRLVYRGAIDDDARNADAVDEPYLMDALRAVANDRPVETSVTNPVGCEIEDVE